MGVGRLDREVGIDIARTDREVTRRSAPALAQRAVERPDLDLEVIRHPDVGALGTQSTRGGLAERVRRAAAWVSESLHARKLARCVEEPHLGSEHVARHDLPVDKTHRPEAGAEATSEDRRKQVPGIGRILSYHHLGLGR